MPEPTPAEDLRNGSTRIRQYVRDYGARTAEPFLLAVAEWLDVTAAQYNEAEAAHWQVEYHQTRLTVAAALAVARAFLDGPDA